jgi:hypothetical protein
MSYNGSGTFTINTSGQPVVAGTVITASAFNALTADLATGLTTAITKDGQTTTTARIPFAQGINSSLVTDASSTSTGSIITAGGVGIAKALYVGTTANVAGEASISGLTVGKGGGAVATNTAVGASALVNNTTGSESVAVGQNAIGSGVMTGAHNTTVGVASMYPITSGAENSGLGYQALRLLTTGSYNTSVGSAALYSNTTASNNVAVGYQAAYSTTTGKPNTALGTQALYANTTGTFNVALGSGQVGVSEGALLANTTGSYNVAVGSAALGTNTTASYSTAVGYKAGYGVTGAQNDAFGVGSLSGLSGSTTGTLNTGLGANTLAYLTSGSYNTAVGQYALLNSTTASYSTAVGYQALQASTTANYNTSLGWQAGYSITTGGSNLCLGAGAGAVVTTGINNVYLGYTGASATGASSELVIAASNTNITGKGTNTGLIVAYNSGYGSIYQGNNGASWAIISDQRLKKNIVDNTDGLDKITQIQVRNFEYRLPEEITELPQDQAIQKQGIQLGAIAQELKEILPDCVKTESTGVMTVNTDNLTWYMINAIKELKAEFDAYKSTHP